MLIFPAPAGQTVVFTRKGLILTLANKEGGAHIDEVSDDYRRYILERAFPIQFSVNGKDLITDTVHLARYAAAEAGCMLLHALPRKFDWLRQYSAEILPSPQKQTLA